MQFLNELYVRMTSLRDEEGQGMAEYGLILALVAVLCVAAFGLLKDGIVATIGDVTAAL